ncbi:putative fimbrial protein [Paraburkholderia ribeironis]|uniref:Putative fimbrial protein n=2 Tax=Paraburkholderia ribeironis TaxID=1247936 RepID=A0A1N7RKT5_9BURK|nr:putative fimbrial protein [Paraburkholderia ribeironis]
MMMSRLTGLLCLVLALMLPAMARAGCTGTASQNALNIQPKVPVFDPAAADGTVLWSSGLLNSSVSTAVTCSDGYGTVVETGVGTYNSTYQTFSTNVPGIGVRLQDINKTPLPVNISSWASLTNLAGGTVAPFYVQIVKTGPVTAGGSISGNIVKFLAQNGTYPMMYVYFTGPIIINPTIPTCAVTNPQITVPLGSVAASSLASAPQSSFNIGLNCSGGASGVTASVYTTLTDQSNPGNVSNTLSLTSASTARGVGIQIQNGPNVISYGPDSKTIGNTNQWLAGQTGNGSFTIPLTARYVQTATSITPGTANGIATFTIGYQ